MTLRDCPFASNTDSGFGAAALLSTSTAEAQTNPSPTSDQPSASTAASNESSRPATTTFFVDTGLWYVPTAETPSQISVDYVFSLWICVASVGFKGRIGTFTIEQQVVPLERIREPIEPFASLIRDRKEEPPRSSAASGE